MSEHNKTGISGEELAIRFLKEKGYEILEKNWRFQHEEIDIIALKEGILVIAEVKTRRSNYFGDPEEFVTRQKQKHLIRAANAYIERNNLDVEARFDIISVIISGQKNKVHHIEDAFHPVA